MKNNFLITLISFLFLTATTKAQVEKMIVETYYVADSNDVKDTTYGKLDLGAVTYRIYLDLAENTILKSIYGVPNHPLKITSTAPFYNQTDRGKTIGKDIDSKKLTENTLALDSWITLQQATKNHVGVLKNQDADGSMVGGVNNDDGLLINNDPSIGISLLVADGLIPVSTDYAYTQFGFTEKDSTIFGKKSKYGSTFATNFAFVECKKGLKGLTSDNIILVAQLTTAGKISFELNIEVEENGKTVKYVADQSTLEEGEKHSRYLKYPADAEICGCYDINYIEYDEKNVNCPVQDSCKTLVVIGCMDPMACNYNSKATKNIQELCCYPGNCADRDIALVCPALPNRESLENEIKLYPNPAQDKFMVETIVPINNYQLYDSYGRLLLQEKMALTVTNQQIDITSLSKGLYLFRLELANGIVYSKTIIKN